MKNHQAHSQIIPIMNQNRHQHQHHVKYVFKLVIFVILTATALIPVIYILGNQKVIIRHTLKQHPLFAYYDEYFTRSNITRQMIINKFQQIQSYQQITESIRNGKSQNENDNYNQNQSQNQNNNHNNHKQKTTNVKRFQSQNVINLIGLGNQSRDIDNLAFAVEYISYIANKQTKIIKKYLHSQIFYQNVLSEQTQIQKSELLQDQKQEDDEQIKLQSIKIDQTQYISNKFSQYFMHFFDISEQLQQLAKKPILYNFKDYIDKNLQRFKTAIASYTKNNDKSQNKSKSKMQTRYWIILYLNNEQNTGSPQATKQNFLLLKQLKTLIKRYHQDRFVIISLNSIPQISVTRQIFLPKTSTDIFENLLKLYLQNVTQNQIKAISGHYDYSLLGLSKDVHDQETFNLYDMVGGRLGYRNFSYLKPKYQNNIQKLCQQNKSTEQRHSRQQQRMNFYRIGLYEFDSHYAWKNKYVKMNYEFQSGILCPGISADGLSFQNIGQSLIKKYAKTIRRFFRKNVQKLVRFIQIEQQYQEESPVSAYEAQVQSVEQKGDAKNRNKNNKPKKQQQQLQQEHHKQKKQNNKKDKKSKKDKKQKHKAEDSKPSQTQQKLQQPEPQPQKHHPQQKQQQL